MDVSAAFLADTAIVEAGRLRVEGGVWDRLNAPSFPAAHPLQVVLLVRPTPPDLNRVQHGEITLTSPGGNVAARTTFELTLQQLADQVPLVLTVPATFTEAGQYVLRVAVENKPKARLTFAVAGPPRAATRPTPTSI